MTHRALKTITYGLGTLVLIVVLFIVFFDWNWLRQPIEHIVKDKTGRTLLIKGNLSVQLGWPIIHFQLGDVTFANPGWAAQPLMLSVKRIDSGIDLARLFDHEVLIPDVRLEQPLIFLEISPDGRKNWLLDRNQKKSSATPTIGNILLDSGQITFLQPAQHTDIVALLSTRQIAPGRSAGDIVFSASGKLKGLSLKAHGNGGRILSLNDKTRPYHLNIAAQLGQTKVNATGTITNLAHFSAADLEVALSGESLDQLYPLIGITLPSTPEYATKGHLLHNDKKWQYENFIGRIGKSDIEGNFAIDQNGQRPFLSGNMTSRLLDLADLGPLIGKKPTPKITAKTNGEERSAAATSVKKDVLPDMPFRTQRWGKMNADVTVHATRIERAKALPIDNLTTRIQLHDSILTLNPLDFGVAGGKLEGAITLDGQRNPIHAAILVHARKLLLKKLFPTVKLSKTSIGQVNGDFDLSGNGNAVKQMLGSANGKFVLLIDSGEISKMMLETAQLHLWEMLETKLFGDKNIKINCAIANFNVDNGIFQTQTLLLDTGITTVIGSGDIDMKQESLHIDLKPHTKVMSPVALRTPIYIRGTFAKPDITVNKTDLALQGAGAVALGAINPLLAILPLIETGPGKHSECGKLIEQAQTSRGRIDQSATGKAAAPATNTPSLPGGGQSGNK
ncbi:MAG TPA: AsmA family protein [Burkholderiales bacterium]|nr:AsmA family protein [Burkholderiales bacterium]